MSVVNIILRTLHNLAYTNDLAGTCHAMICHSIPCSEIVSDFNSIQFASLRGIWDQIIANLTFSYTINNEQQRRKLTYHTNSHIHQISRIKRVFPNTCRAVRTFNVWQIQHCTSYCGIIIFNNIVKLSSQHFCSWFAWQHVNFSFKSFDFLWLSFHGF
jgi:hypothetical protein